MGRLSKTTRQRRDALREINEKRKHEKLMRQKKLRVINVEVHDDNNQTMGIHLPHSSNSIQLGLSQTVSLLPNNERSSIPVDAETQVMPKTKSKLSLRLSPQKKINVKSGRRIIAISSLDDLMQQVSLHSSICGKGPIKRKSEQQSGLRTNVVYKCVCGKQFSVSSDGQGNTLPINEAAAWGAVQSALGFKATTQLLATIDIPTPSFKTFQKSQNKFYHQLIPAMHKDMKKWAAQEAELARKLGDVVTINNVEYAATTVIVDGGWSKRSYKHSFSSNCGVAVIIGAHTKKILYMGTKTRTCAVCDRKRKTSDIPLHECYKNYDGPPTGMESMIILEGFKDSMNAYGLVYWKFIGDGDSSVHSKVLNVYPGIQVEKIECTNHVVRNCTTKLMDISMGRIKGKENFCISLEERRLFNPTIHRFRTGLVKAIDHHHNNTQSTWKDLYDDIHNIRFHIFGQHDNCKKYFCTGPKEKEQNRVSTISTTPLWKALEHALDRPAQLSPSLIRKESSNCAESFMSVACKYVEGKRKNFGQRNLYQVRMAAAVFSYNGTSFWADKALELIYGKPPGVCWEAKSKEANNEKNTTRKYRVKRPLKVPQLAAASYEYGENPQRPDLSDDVLRVKIVERKFSLQVSMQQATEIEATTVQQAESDEWIKQRKERITASWAGLIYNLRDTTDNSSTLNSFFGHRKKSVAVIEAMNFGKISETRAIEKYEEIQHFETGTVKKAGFVVYQQNGIFGASPDGYVGTDGILEVKCPHSLHVRKESPVNWPVISKSSSLKTEKGQLRLKRTHAHYFQMIMQIYVTGRLWCDYFVWSEHGHYLERIHRTSETDILWEKMTVKLERFWMEDIAPELVDSRFDRGYTEYRCPKVRIADRQRKANMRKQKKEAVTR